MLFLALMLWLLDVRVQVVILWVCLGLRSFPWCGSFRFKSKIGLPWWRSGWESTCRCRGHRFMPQSRKIPHAVKQLGPWAMAAEPAHLEPVLHNRRGHSSERPMWHTHTKKDLHVLTHLLLTITLWVTFIRIFTLQIRKLKNREF